MRRDAELVKFLLVVGATLGAVVGDEDELFAWNDPSTSRILHDEHLFAYPCSSTSLVSPEHGHRGDRRTIVRLSFIYNQPPYPL